MKIIIISILISLIGCGGQLIIERPGGDDILQVNGDFDNIGDLDNGDSDKDLNYPGSTFETIIDDVIFIWGYNRQSFQH